MQFEAVDRVPAACPLQTGTVALMEACGTYWPEAHKEHDKMAELALAAQKFAGIESVRVPFHNDYEAEAMGCVLGGWKRDRQPSKIDFAVKNVENIDGLRVPDPYKDGRMPVVLEAVSLLSKRVGKRLPVIAAISDPFEMAVRLRGIANIMRDIFMRPEALKKLLRITTETAIDYGRALIDSGASAITLVAGTSSTPLLGKEFYMEFSQPFEREVIKKLNTLTVLHICGKTKLALNEIADTSASGISIDSVVDIAEAKKIVGKKAAIVGNVSPIGSLLRGSPEKVEVEAKKCIEKGVDVLAPGCGFSPLTPLENMKVFAKAVKKYT